MLRRQVLQRRQELLLGEQEREDGRQLLRRADAQLKERRSFVGAVTAFVDAPAFHVQHELPTGAPPANNSQPDVRRAEAVKPGDQTVPAWSYLRERKISVFICRYSRKKLMPVFSKQSNAAPRHRYRRWVDGTSRQSPKNERTIINLVVVFVLDGALDRCRFLGLSSGYSDREQKYRCEPSQGLHLSNSL